jgi:hypothetical protein
MVVLRCTQKLLVRLKRADVSLGEESTTRLGDWYGNILRIGRQQHLLFISEHSRLPVIIPIREARWLEAIFPDAVVCENSAGELCGGAVVELEHSAQPLAALHVALTDRRGLAGDDLVAQTLVRPFLMIVIDKRPNGVS